MQPPAEEPSPAPRRGTAAGRDAWIDAARGLTIGLVVLFHADAVQYSFAPGERSMAVHLAALALFPLRMPLFFLLSGVLGAAALARPARRVVAGRAGHFLWVWAVWTAAGYGLVGGLVFPALGLGRVHGFFEPGGDPLAPGLDPLGHLITCSSGWTGRTRSRAGAGRCS
jgi:uncharacterized membrane protein YcfT